MYIATIRVWGNLANDCAAGYAFLLTGLHAVL